MEDLKVNSSNGIQTGNKNFYIVIGTIKSMDYIRLGMKMVIARFCLPMSMVSEWVITHDGIEIMAE